MSLANLPADLLGGWGVVQDQLALDFQALHPLEQIAQLYPWSGIEEQQIFQVQLNAAVLVVQEREIWDDHQDSHPGLARLGKFNGAIDGALILFLATQD